MSIKVTLNDLRNACHKFIGSPLWAEGKNGGRIEIGVGRKTRIKRGKLFVIYELNEEGRRLEGRRKIIAPVMMVTK